MSRLHYLQIDQNKLPLEPHNLGVPSGASKRISEPMVRLAPTVHLSYTNTNCLQTDRNEIPHDPYHLGVPSNASKTIYETMVCSAQTNNLSCIKVSTISKWTEMSFHLSLFTHENHQVRPARIMSLWDIWCKPGTYLARTLTLSPNGPKHDST